MSRLLSRIMLALLMLPLATVVYVIVVVVCFDAINFRHNTIPFVIATSAAWAFIAAYWTMLWRATVQWTSRRVIATAIAVPAALVAGLLIGAPVSAIEEGFGSFIGGVSAVLLWITATVFIWRETPTERSARVSRSGQALVCPTCGYNLTGLRELACPECGGRWTIQELVALQPGTDDVG